MAGRKFGTEGCEDLTWAMNVLVPGYVGEVFRNSRIVAFSTGCVYPLVGVETCGCTEDIMALDKLSEKIKAFGWEVVEINGHDYNEIYNANDLFSVEQNAQGLGTTMAGDNTACSGNVNLLEAVQTLQISFHLIKDLLITTGVCEEHTSGIGIQKCLLQILRVL